MSKRMGGPGQRIGRAAAAAAAVLLAAAGLVGCGERHQGELDGARAGSRHRADQALANGTGHAAFTAPGWKAGDEASWQSQLRNRAQAQNEYVRLPAAPRASAVPALAVASSQPAAAVASAPQQ